MQEITDRTVVMIASAPRRRRAHFYSADSLGDERIARDLEHV